ncbi:DUF4365 domain-containing protein [Nonomuraea sp. NPDC050556]|uniref:DUF4365 domain-containing protein n=1 Tax=Nonomuraea sp. NPDC050556 TaxID=3364369 RepID=UPI0037B875F8
MSIAASWQKEQFSKAYMLAVASQGGYTIGEWNVDKDGVDVTLRSGGLMVDLQLKCTQRPRTTSDDYVFDLDVPTYNKLRDPYRSAPGYMALVVVPPILDEWLLHEPERLLLSCHAYWAKLQDEPPPTSSATTSIRLPRCQSLTASSIEIMFEVALSRILGTAGGDSA